MVDDDVTDVRRTYLPGGAKRPARLTVDEIADAIQATAETAAGFGAYLFGWSTCSDPLNYTPQQPFRLTGYVNGCAMGIRRGSKLFFHGDALTVEDYWISLINAYRHRHVFVDLRFAVTAGFVSAGGMAETRTAEATENGYALLKANFGAAVGRKKPGNSWGQKPRPAVAGPVMHLPF
jgi:hypothetical protein